MRTHLNAFTVSLALHLALVVMLIARTASEIEAPPPAKVERTIMIEWPPTMPPSPAGGAKASAGIRRLRPDDDLVLEADESRLELGRFTFNLAPIAARARELFPFLTDVIEIEPALAAMREAKTGGLVSPLPRAASAGDKPPLMMSDGEMHKLVDGLFTRRERWDGFQQIAALTRDYDADRGQLPVLLRRYVDHNVLQPYIDSPTRDPRLWVMLGLAAEHTDFVAFITRYAAENPSSRTTTELMFLLDDLAQGSRDTLLVLFDIAPHKDLWWTGVFQPQAQRFVAGLQGYYSIGFERSPVQLKESVKAHYDRVRIAILESIIDATPGGYRASDARFLIGSIHWSQRRPDRAIGVWRTMSRHATDEYADATAAMLVAVNAPVVSAEEITNILSRQRAQWADFWYGRLRRFGYRGDSF